MKTRKRLLCPAFANYSANVDPVTEKRPPRRTAPRRAGPSRRSVIFFADNRSVAPFPSNIRSDLTFLIVHTSSRKEYTHEDRRRKREGRR